MKHNKTYLIASSILIICIILILAWIIWPKSTSIATQNTNTINTSNSVASSLEPENKASSGNQSSKLILKKATPNQNIKFNVALNLTDKNSVYGFDRDKGSFSKFYKYLQLPYEVKAQLLKVSNYHIFQHYILDDQSNTKVSTTDFNQQSSNITLLPEKNLGVIIERLSESKNIIWFGDSNHGKAYIFTKSTKDEVGTYLFNIDKNTESKISDQYCDWISSFNENLWCINDQRKLANITSNESFEDFGRILELNNGKILAVKNDSEIWEIDLAGNKPEYKKSVIKAPDQELITYISQTNQGEILIQFARNLESKPEFYTMEFKDQGLISRPEFGEYTIIL